MQGTIRDYQTDETIAGVIVKLSIYTVKHVDDSQQVTTLVLTDTTDAAGRYEFYYEGDFDSGRLFCGKVPSGYAGFELRKKLNRNESYNLDLSVYPLDSYVRLRAKNERLNGTFYGIRIWGISDGFSNVQDFAFDPDLLTGDSTYIDSIKVCGEMNYVISKYNDVNPYEQDTIFCPLGFSEVIIKI